MSYHEELSIVRVLARRLHEEGSDLMVRVRCESKGEVAALRLALTPEELAHVYIVVDELPAEVE